MNIYNSKGKSNRRKSTCGYCRAEGHNQTECPRVPEDYAFFTQSPPVIPIGISATPNTCSWYKNPKYWGDWYENCMTAHAKQEQAKKLDSTGRVRSAPKCGFCGSTDHNRRNCQKMVAYIDKAHRANQNWRRAFYDRYVKELGLSEGALVDIEGHQTWRYPAIKGIGIVTSINWDEISMFCSQPNRWVDGDYRQRLTIRVQLGEEKVVIERDCRASGYDETLVNYWGSNSFSDRGANLMSVLSPSDTPLGEEWIEEGHRKSLEFLTKKRSLEKLDDDGVTAWINKWL